MSPSSVSNETSSSASNSRVSSAESPQALAHAGLTQRARQVRGLLGPARNQSGEHREHVHHLRVAIRRGVAALELFRDWLPGGRRKRLVRRLKALRRGVGRARDLDVLLERLIMEPLPLSTAARADLIHFAVIERANAQRALRHAIRRFSAHRTCVRPRRWSARFRWRAPRPEPPLDSFLVTALEDCLEQFAAIVARAEPDAFDWHALRIAGKRLRYLLEIVQPVLPPLADHQIVADLIELQDELGRWNDCRIALETWGRWHQRCHGPLRRSLERLQELDGQIFERISVTLRSTFTPTRLAAFVANLRSRLQPAPSGLALHQNQPAIGQAMND